MHVSPGHIKPAVLDDQPAIAQLLQIAGLPTPDEHNPRLHMLVACDEDMVVGCIGWERYDDDVLLRSLVVAPERRGGRIGERLMRTAVDMLSAAGIHNLYLLTTGTAGFFERHGFTTIDGGALPAAVQKSSQVTGTCCARADCMQLVLGVAHADSAHR